MKLCSFIIPTRNRHDWLRKAVGSIVNAPGTNTDDLEILLRVDDDDPDRFFLAEELTKGVGSYVIGPRGNAYLDMGRFVDDLVKIATGKFCWLFDDDAWLTGNWYGPLSTMPDACAVNAEFYCLGGSTYRNGPEGGAVGLAIPTSLAKTIPHTNPVDDCWLTTILAKGWKVRQLQGVSYLHEGRAR